MKTGRNRFLKINIGLKNSFSFKWKQKCMHRELIFFLNETRIGNPVVSNLDYSASPTYSSYLYISLLLQCSLIASFL